MHSIATLRKLTTAEHAPAQRARIDARNVLQVAFIHTFAPSLNTLATRNGAPVSPTTCRMLKSVPAPSKWERYREALDEEQVPSLLLSSLDTPVEQFAPDATWVVALDPDDLSLERLGHVLGLGAPARASSSHTRFVALCSHGTSPAKLCRLFSAGAYLSEQDIAPQALLRLCRLAARDSRAPLMRFSERAGFSEAEQRAFFAECAGLSKCEAADELRCSPRTLETYWSRIFAKLRIRSTDGVVAAALRFAMLDSGAAA